MAAVTIDRIAAVHADITETVIKTTGNSTLSRQEQDNLLAQTCAEACDLLTDWLGDESWWAGRGPSDRTIADSVPDQQDYVRLLGPMFKDAFAAAGKHGILIPDSYFEEARKRVAETARRHRKMRPAELFEQARQHVTLLRDEICKLAGELKTSPSKRPRALRLLRNVRQLLVTIALPIVLAMVAASPHQMSADIAGWHDVASVVVMHEVAYNAQPNIQIAPPRLGPSIR
jgi:hypothetical protein